MSSEIYPSKLFTRQQIAGFTGIDASTLNYWMREGVLRAAKGGSGRGSHRQFPYHQVTLAALLNELRKFGIGTPAISRLAQQFHNAFDWMEERGISRTNLERISDAWLIRKTIVKDGFWRWRITNGAEEELFAGIERHRYHDWVYVHLNWEQATAFWFRPRVPSWPHLEITQEEIMLVSSWKTEEDLRVFNENSAYYRTITSINLRESGENFSTSPDFFYHNRNGDLVMTPDAREAQRAVGFIGIDIERLTCSLWSGRL